MLLALAQIKPHKGDIQQNIADHLEWIDHAVQAKADIIFFPELSLTGYEPELAEQLAMEPNDTMLDVFQSVSDAKEIAICVGLPLRSKDGVQIGIMIFLPGKTREVYAKQMLHADELPYFIPGGKQKIITLKGIPVAPAICYESLQKEHFEKAFELGARIYVACVAKSQPGIDKAFTHFPKIAAKYNVPVFMVNSIGQCDNFISAGQSAVWDKNGALVESLGIADCRLLISDCRFIG